MVNVTATPEGNVMTTIDGEEYVYSESSRHKERARRSPMRMAADAARY